MGVFVDVEGREWSPRVTTPVLLKVCRKLNLKLSDLTAMNVDLADALEWGLWFAVEKQAQEWKVSREAFLEGLSLVQLREACQAVFVELKEAFPEMDSAGGGGGSGPFVPGKSGT